MSRKTIGTAPESNEQITAAAPMVAAKPEANPSGFYCYIGPSMTGIISNGAVFVGTRAQALKDAAAAIERHPLVKTLIVSGTELPEARLRVKRSGNALNANYKKIVADMRRK